MRITIICLTDGHIQIYDTDGISKNKDSKVKPLRKSPKGMGKKESGTTPHQRHEGGQEGAKTSKKEACKTTITTKTNKESGLRVLKVDKNQRRVQVRPPGTKVPRGNSMRSLDKKGKEKRKVVRN